MLGLPLSKELNRDVIYELEKVLKYEPKHFSVYILTVKNNYTHFEKLPNEEWIEKEYKQVATFLTSHGYSHYEVSNFALPGFESKHNLNYWKSKTVAALGPSATGFLAEDKIRYKWKTKEAVMDLETLELDEFRLEQLYMAIRAEGLNLKELISANAQWKTISDRWVNDGLAVVDTELKLKLTSNGYLLLDSLMNDIFIAKLV
jgi:oxygen-independent coproporphyrinogen-3 oxidase